MNLSSHLIVFVLSCLIIVSCGASNQESQQSEKPELGKEHIAMDTPVPIPPNHCKVRATVVSIDKTMKGTSEKDPCGKAPCLSTVRIDSILGYGSAFPGGLTVGQVISVKFAHTLNPTKETQPEIIPPLPGLTNGSAFEALIRGSHAMGKTEPEFTVYGYQKK